MDRTNVLTVEDIDFHPLSATEWRVLDRRYPAHSIDALLGFVARQESTYFATWMHHPLAAEQCTSLKRVAEYFVREAAREARGAALANSSSA